MFKTPGNQTSTQAAFIGREFGAAPTATSEPQPQIGVTQMLGELEQALAENVSAIGNLVDRLCPLLPELPQSPEPPAGATQCGPHTSMSVAVSRLESAVRQLRQQTHAINVLRSIVEV